MSFSAHADAKGIMQLIRMAEPRNMLLVHGEAAKMEFLKGKIEQEFSKSVCIRLDITTDGFIKMIWHSAVKKYYRKKDTVQIHYFLF